MIYYIKMKDNFYPISNLGGSTAGFNQAGDGWTLSINRRDGHTISIEKCDTDGNLYSKIQDNKDFELQLPVNIDELNLKDNDTFNLSIEDARLAILKLNNYFTNINEMKCITK